DDVAFVSGKGTVMPQNLQIDAGAWIDISGSLGSPGRKSGLAIICDPQTPNYPAPWILRQKGSMQNIVYPGRQRVTLPVDSDLVLKYRIIVHSGQTDYLTDKKVMID
ncbi:MAG TPA: PmoA family protein, partial [Bacteroidales bacterium]|nr:PmoA family protein [Bacteroidales bacterium]